MLDATERVDDSAHPPCVHYSGRWRIWHPNHQENKKSIEPALHLKLIMDVCAWQCGHTLGAQGRRSRSPPTASPNWMDWSFTSACLVFNSHTRLVSSLHCDWLTGCRTLQNPGSNMILQVFFMRHLDSVVSEFGTIRHRIMTDVYFFFREYCAKLCNFHFILEKIRARQYNIIFGLFFF